MDPIDRQARLHRSATLHAEPKVVWSNVSLIHVHHPDPSYSIKLFFGGLPRDITEVSQTQIFAQLDPSKSNDWNETCCVSGPNLQKAGFVYIIFEH